MSQYRAYFVPNGSDPSGMKLTIKADPMSEKGAPWGVKNLAEGELGVTESSYEVACDCSRTCCEEPKEMTSLDEILDSFPTTLEDALKKYTVDCTITVKSEIWIDDDVPVNKRAGVYGHEQYHVRNKIYHARSMERLYKRELPACTKMESECQRNAIIMKLKLANALETIRVRNIGDHNLVFEDENGVPHPRPRPAGEFAHPDGRPLAGKHYKPRGFFDPNAPTL